MKFLSEEFAHDETEESAHDENEYFAREEIKEIHEEISHDEKEESATRNGNEEPVHNENEPSLAGADLEVPVEDDSSPLAGANTVDTNRSDADSMLEHLMLSTHEQLKQPRKSVHQGYGNLKSEELNPSSELSGSLRNISKSPTRASRAYDGSISSYDGLDDHFPTCRLHSLEDTYKAKRQYLQYSPRNETA
ncbi:hypothetical protein TIFTF001_010228 [Ficus carica]|uniref:Uncharacterized protein n=1 Tax=Ficus carica TaxID=3494 RepID=A0AA88DHM9_FICCA|nr:hypothetical protein TIFTF001_010228 [Ficus carica]